METSLKKSLHTLALPNKLPNSSAHRKAELLQPFPHKNRKIRLFFSRHGSEAPAQMRLSISDKCKLPMQKRSCDNHLAKEHN